MRVAVIGSGPSGIAAADVLSERGVDVDLFDGGEMLDPSGRELSQTIVEELQQGRRPARSLMNILRFGHKRTDNSAQLSAAFSAVFRRRVDPRQLEKRIFGSDFAFRNGDRGTPIVGAWMPRSLATGGLSNVWGAACYPLRLGDYNDWPLTEGDLAPWYARAQRLAGVCGETDALNSVYPLYDTPLPATGEHAFDPVSPLELTLARWRRDQHRLAKLGLVGGRPRLAVAPPTSGGAGCLRCGLCLFGCPADVIWHADKALQTQGQLTRVTYRRGTFVRSLVHRNDSVWLKTGLDEANEKECGPYRAVLLAAGPLSSLRIALDSLQLSRHECRIVENDAYVIPFRMVDKAMADRAPVKFGLSQAVLAIEPDRVGRRAAHLQFYRITEPVLGSPGRLLGALPWHIGESAFKHLHGYLIGLFYLHSDDSRNICVEVAGKRDGISVLRVTSKQDAGPSTQSRIVRFLESAGTVTGLKPLSRLVRYGPPGFSGHIGGTLPMSARPTLLQTHSDGRVEGLSAVYSVDMSVFPTMPAQNPTLTSMANAMRCAALLADKLLAPGVI